MKFLIFSLFFGFLTIGDAEVLLQMRKDANVSTLDAGMHRNVSGEKLPHQFKKMSRKQLRTQSSSDEASSETAHLPKVVGKKSEGLDELLKLVKEALHDLEKDQSFRSKKSKKTKEAAPRLQTICIGIGIEMRKHLAAKVQRLLESLLPKKSSNIPRKVEIVFRALQADM